MKAPEQVKLSLKELIITLADILNTDILNQIKTNNEDQMVKHFAKTISITLGRLGRLDP